MKSSRTSQKGLKQRTVSAMVWSAIGTSGATIITFIANMVLARLLMPEDFGCIGMLQIFISVGDAFVGGGFGQALIQKKNPTHVDYSTVFIWNLFASAVLYLVLFISAPSIARFYNMPLLCKVLRLQSINLLIHAFIVVQNNQLRKQLRFRDLSIRNILAASTGTVIAIVVALSGGGVWSLVASSLSSATMNVILLWKMSKWRPTWEFDWSSFKELFSFGGLIALSNMVERFFTHIQGVIIGKWYSAGDMGYYSQASKLEQIPNQTLSQIVSEVSFPVFSELQNDISRLRQGVKKNIQTLVFLNFPMCCLMYVVAAPLIHLLYGPKWDPSIPYFQILCIGGLVHSANSMNMNVVKALGKGKIYLFTQITKRVFRIITLVVGAFFGIKGLLWGVVVSRFFNYVLNAFINNRLINYGMFEQIKDISSTLLLAIIAGVFAFLVGLLPHMNQYIIMLLQICVYLAVYLGASYSMKIEALFTYNDILKGFIHSNSSAANKYDENDDS